VACDRGERPPLNLLLNCPLLIEELKSFYPPYAKGADLDKYLLSLPNLGNIVEEFEDTKETPADALRESFRRFEEEHQRLRTLAASEKGLSLLQQTTGARILRTLRQNCRDGVHATRANIQARRQSLARRQHQLSQVKLITLLS
jgi:hypothetical protein